MKNDPMQKRKVWVTIGILAGIFVTVFSIRAFRSFIRQHRVFVSKAAKGEGNLQANLHIVEYTDFQCPACAGGALLLKEYLTRYPDRLYVEYRHFPLDMHPRAKDVAIAAECAARQKKFWKFYDLAFERQALLRESINFSQRLLEIAELAHLKKTEFEKCLADPQAARAVEEDRAEGRSRQVKATPTFFLNNDQMVVGSIKLQEELEKRLGKP